MNETALNIPNVKPNDIIEKLSALYIGAIEKNIPLKRIPTVFLWGAPGVGKSQSIIETAQNIEARSGKRTKVTDVRLLLFSPIDLRGVPVADDKREFTDWLKPRIFDMDAGSDSINILFLDELSAAPQSVQAAAYQICLDRKIGEHILPDNCIVIAAGNRTTDHSVAYKMPKALANRLMHFNVEPSFDSWRCWAIKSGIDSRVIAYLEMDRSRLCVEPESSDLAYPTPRSWEFVSNLIKTLPDQSLKSLSVYISGLVGTDTAFEFITFCEGYMSMPSVEDIKKGKCHELPRSEDVLFAVNRALVEEIKKNPLSDTELENICNYLYRFPKDFITVFIEDLSTGSKANPAFKKSYAFQKLYIKVNGGNIWTETQ